MTAGPGPWLALVVLGLLLRPASAQWHCRQGRVELIGGGAQGCVESAPTSPPASPPNLVVAPTSQRQRDITRRAILENELRQEHAALAALQRDGRAADAAQRRRAQDNIDALRRELAR
ncbi:hypothetical protein KAK06_15280 [Ideonella sp. 4Y11]|uniref:DUF4124 domain-containing protein n=1 Tax=Ideonella aquatica TaxID=2824119 RepID=A0A940YPU9_9BURK|nr:hypothetical protein [Ideonella aquatica]MBQ0960316.1 hypothetical protein [Ideonella aquatica]